ncbi:MAG: ATP-dependent zinc metalloprotease FtsH [Oligoflexia bacterium]|nr:ATP-dependent zinc metalloprotease FtsH [Oligoflexia bacterium]
MDMKPNLGRPPRFSILYFLLAVWLALFFFDFVRYSRNVEIIPYSQFITYLDQEKVASVSVGREKIEGTFKTAPKGQRKQFMTIRVEDPALPDRLTAAKASFTGVQESTFWRDVLSWVVPAVILAMVWLFLMNRMGQASGRGGGMLPLGKSKAKIYVEKGVKHRFENVAGVDEAKDELQEVVNYLRDPKKYSKLGGRMPKGVMLVGPPGTGKTLLARAVAGEAGVPFFSINGSEFVELFVGLGAARVRDLFEQARAQAPCIIFIDELDALGKARGLTAVTGASNDEKEQTLNQLLAELDGFDPSVGIIIIGATNRPEVLDQALLRSGRFDRQIVLDKPDRRGREKILEVHLKSIKMAKGVSVPTIASLTAGFSGADLANLVNEAALIATRRGAEEVQLPDFTQGIERIVAGLERKSRILNPSDKKRVAYHEMGHAVVALALGEDEAVHKVSVIPRGIGALGYTLRRPTEDRYMMSKAELESKLAIALGGRASEAIFFREVTTGAADDLEKATEVAHAMVTRYGMSPELGLATFERDAAPFLGGQSTMRTAYSERTARLIDQEVAGLLNHAFQNATEVIWRNRELIEEGARLLLEKETIDEAQLKELWDRHRSAHEEDTGPAPKPVLRAS